MEKKEVLTEKHLSSMMEKLKLLHSSIQPVSYDHIPGLRGLVLQLFGITCNMSFTSSKEEIWENHLHVRDLITQIKKETHSPTIRPHLKSLDRKKQITRLLQWGKDQEVNLDCIDINENLSSTDSKSPIGYGLKVTKDLKKSERILEIPRNMMMCADDVVKTDYLKSFATQDPLVCAMPNVALSFALLIECYLGKSSRWKTYIDSLPAEHYSICYFTVEDFEMLKSSPSFFDAIQLWTSFVRQYAYLHNRFLEIQSSINTKEGKGISNEIKSMVTDFKLAEKFNIDDYFWAVSTVMTRVNVIPITREKNNTLALIPIIDICNHEETSNMLTYDFEKKCCCVSIQEELIKKDSELRIFYGSRPTSLMFMHNGFFFENNSFDYIVVNLGKVIDGDLFESRKELLNELDTFDRKCLPFTKSSPWQNNNIKAVYRLLYCTETEYKVLLDTDKATAINNLYSKEGISKECDKNAIENLALHLTAILNEYPSELKEKNSSYIQKYCKMLVENEMGILTYCLSELQKMQQL